MFDAVDSSQLQKHLHVIAKELHLAGTPANDAVGDYLVEKYRSYGFDVRTYEYTVLLSYPNFTEPNTVTLSVDGGNETELISDGLGEFLGPLDAVQQGCFDAVDVVTRRAPQKVPIHMCVCNGTPIQKAAAPPLVSSTLTLAL